MWNELVLITQTMLSSNSGPNLQTSLVLGLKVFTVMPAVTCPNNLTSSRKVGLELKARDLSRYLFFLHLMEYDEILNFNSLT